MELRLVLYIIADPRFMMKRNWWDELGSISGSHGVFCIRGDPLFAFRRNLVVLVGSNSRPGVELFGAQAPQ